LEQDSSNRLYLQKPPRAQFNADGGIAASKVQRVWLSIFAEELPNLVEGQLRRGFAINRGQTIAAGHPSACSW